MTYRDEISVLPRRPAAILRWLICAAVLLVLPLVAGDYLITQANFIIIYAIAGLGLQILIGYTGQLSLGHAAFVAIGAYACGYLEKIGVPFPAALPGAIAVTTMFGTVMARPALRISGHSLLVATIAMAVIVQEIATRWSSVTGGNSGMMISSIKLFGLTLARPADLYYFYLPLLVGGLLIAANVLRSPLGRAMTAVRDSEVAARSMGVDVARTKTIAFGLSAAFAGLAGALYAHQIRYISPEQFTIELSTQFLIMLMVGGVGSLAGVVFGAVFMVMLPEALGLVFQAFGSSGSGPTGARPIIEGSILILIMLYEPFGIHGILLRVKAHIRRRRVAMAPGAAMKPQTEPG